MRTSHRLIAVIAAVSLCGVMSCGKRAEKPTPVAVSALRYPVGSEIHFPGAVKPYRVPLDDSLAARRSKPPGTPRFGQAIYITALPVPVERHAPVYPEILRKAGVSGKVIVHTLVLEDGTVGETWIIQSVPQLDQAAARAVQRWTFTPALDGDKPVAVWVAVPVEFNVGSQ